MVPKNSLVAASLVLGFASLPLAGVAQSFTFDSTGDNENHTASLSANIRF